MLKFSFFFFIFFIYILYVSSINNVNNNHFNSLPYYKQFEELQNSIDNSSYSIITLSYFDSTILFSIKFNENLLKNNKLSKKFSTSPSSIQKNETLTEDFNSEEQDEITSDPSNNIMLHYYFNSNFLVCILEAISSSSSTSTPTSLYNKCQDLLSSEEDEYFDMQAWELASELSEQNHLNSLSLSQTSNSISSASSCLILNFVYDKNVNDNIFKLDLVGNIWQGNGACLGYHSDNLLKKLEELNLNKLFINKNK